MQQRVLTRDWENTFTAWAKPPGPSEQARCDNAVKMIRNAVQAHAVLGPKLSAGLIKVFVQGSYRNRVNVRQDSDVDVGVLYTGSFFASYPEGESAQTFGHETADYKFTQFKDDLEQALVHHVGRDKVKRGNKSITIRETSYHVEADAASFFEHHSYSARDRWTPGVELRPDDAPWRRIVNFPEALFSTWPKEHYEEGRDKNDATRRRYRGVVRILKKLRNEMDEAGHPAAKAVPGYLLECLAWNAPNTSFGPATWDERLGAVIIHIWSNTKEDDDYRDWTEVDAIKYLFRPSQPWTREEAHAFIDAAWDYIGVKA